MVRVDGTREDKYPVVEAVGMFYKRECSIKGDVKKKHFW
jgi:hypothetical protein